MPLSDFLDSEVYLTSFNFNGGAENIISYLITILINLSSRYSALFIDLLLKTFVRITLNYQASGVTQLRSPLLKVWNLNRWKSHEKMKTMKDSLASSSSCYGPIGL